LDLNLYLEPLNLENSAFESGTLGNIIHLHNTKSGLPDLSNKNLALIGVKESRNSNHNTGCSEAPDEVRKYLYPLFAGNPEASIADLGNIVKGNTVSDTYFALTKVVAHLVSNNIIPLIIGGSQDLTFAIYRAYEEMEQTVNLVTVDPSFDLGDLDEEMTSKSFLSKIILHQPNFLFNYSNIGYQTYFVDQRVIDLMSKLYFDTYRLGQVRNNIEDVEPVVRNADILSFDISAVRFADAPGNNYSTPNGFYGEEACQITRYAGMSDKLTSIGFFEINPESDIRGTTSHLVAQMIWYFMEGYYNRKKDYPVGEKTDYLKYRVVIKDNKHELIFYKSNKSDRWWMDVPYPENKKIRFKRHHLVPCSYKDYQTACNDEMPDRWWITYQKLC
jgi:formiminoglutamase